MRRSSFLWRFGAACTTALVGLTLASAAQAQVSACALPAPGDVNGSFDTNVADVQCTILTSLWALAGGTGAEPGCLSTNIYQAGLRYVQGADINCDGQNNVQDVQLDITFALKLKLSLALDKNQDDCVDVCTLDFDGDGIPDTVDCAPYDPRIRPGTALDAPEYCDAIDNRCNSLIDNADPAMITCNDGQVCNGQEACPSMPSGTSLVITEIMINPTGINAPAQWVEIFNPTASDIDLRTWRLLGSGAETFTIAGPQPIIIRSGGFAVLVSNPDFGTNGGISGNRFFPVVPYSGILHVIGSDQVALQNPGGTIVDTVAWNTTNPTWNALLSAPEGASLRFSPAVVQTNPAGIATENNDPAQWAVSGGRWRPETEIDPGPPAIILDESDFGSPGGLWVFGQAVTAPPAVSNNFAGAARCELGTNTTCDAPAFSCLATSCFEATAPHPNAGTNGIAANATAADGTPQAGAGSYNAATGCLVFIAEAYEDVNSGSCDDGRSCTTQACDPAGSGGFLQADTGCRYQAAAGSCTGSDQCNTISCYLDPDTDPTLGAGDDFDGATGCYTDVLVAAACSDDNLCTTGERCGVSGLCDDTSQGTSQAQADDTCDVDQVSCTLDYCIPATGLCNAPANVTDTGYYAAGECAIDTGSGIACVANNATAGGADAVSCLRCNAEIDQTQYTFDPVQDDTRCFIAGVCYSEGDRQVVQGCTACNRDDQANAVTSATSWSPLDSGTSCDSDLSNACFTNEVCNGTGTCGGGDAWVDTCTANSACGTATCVSSNNTPGDNLCAWAPLAPSDARTDCLIGYTAPLANNAATQCVLRGTQSGTNGCQWCNPSVETDGYSPRNRAFAGGSGFAITDTASAANSDFCEAGNGPCLVDRCLIVDDQLALSAQVATCQVHGNWEDLEQDQFTAVTDPVGTDNNCREIDPVSSDNVSTCVDRTCVVNAGNPTCVLVADTNTQCYVDNTCRDPGFNPVNDANTGIGCTSCQPTVSNSSYSPRDPGENCFGGDFCDLYACGGGAQAGQCVVTGDWGAVNCDGFPLSGCGGQANFECVNPLTEAMIIAANQPNSGIFYYENESADTNDFITVVPPTNMPVCRLDVNACTTTCVIGGQNFARGQINPANQCEWCNPDVNITSWSPRTAGQDGYATTLAEAITILTNANTIGAWTFGTTQLADICRPDLAGGNGNGCVVQRCNASAACENHGQWIDLQTNYLTDIVDNEDPLANCLETVGNDPSGTDVSSCVDKTCVLQGGAPTCVLEANGGDTVAQCFIDDGCHADAARHASGGRQIEQCQFCNAAGNPGAWSSEANGTLCNNDDSGCTFGDSCQAGTCTAGAGLPPTCDPNNGPGGSDGFTCTVEACVDGSGDDYADSGDGTDFSCINGTTAPLTVALTAGSCFIETAVDTRTCFTAGAQNPAFTAPSVLANPVCAICNAANDSRNWSANQNAFCTDGSQCSIADACTATVGECRGIEINAVCNDGNPCTIDICSDTAPSLTNPIVSGDAAYPSSVFTGCYYEAAATTTACSDNNLCTFGETCADPTNAAAGTAGLYGTARGQCESGTQISCDDFNECTYNYCNTGTGGCVAAPIPRYFTNEWDDVGQLPLALGTTPAQALDPDLTQADYIANIANAPGSQTATVRACDLTNYCTSGLCNPFGFCLVSNSSSKCQDDGNNSCTSAGCATDGTEATATNMIPGGSVDSEGCYLVAIPNGNLCNATELFANDKCADLDESTCQAGVCQIVAINPATDCPADNGPFQDVQCRQVTCDPNIVQIPGKQMGQQCIFVPSVANTCDDNNACTSTACVPSNAGQANNVITCNASANAIPPYTNAGPNAAQDALCVRENTCHPVLGNHPADLLLARINNALPGSGTGLLGSLAALTSAQVSSITTAAGNPALNTISGEATPTGYNDHIYCHESPDNSCTGPDICGGTGTCGTGAVPHCTALNTNSLCVIYGLQGATVSCPIRLAARSAAEVTAGNMAHSLQLDLRYDSARVSLAGMEDKLCFAPDPGACFMVDVDTFSNSIYPFGHTAAFNPTLLTNWDGYIETGAIGGGRMIITNISSPTRLNLAHFNPEFNPASPPDVDTWTPADLAYVAGPDGDLDLDRPALFNINFTLNQDVLPTNPVILYASDIKGTDVLANLIDIDVWNRIIVTRGYPTNAGCTGQPNGTPCDDGDACTIGDVCFNGNCIPGEYIEDQVCEDGEQCTFVDSCQIGACVSGAAANNPCTFPVDQDVACVISGEEDDTFDCAVYLVSSNSTNSQAVAIDYELYWSNPHLELVAAFDKEGFDRTLPTSGTSRPFSTLSTGNLVTLDAIPANLSTATGSAKFIFWSMTFSPLTEAYLSGGNAISNIVGPMGEPDPGQYMTLRFRLKQDIGAATPALVRYTTGTVATEPTPVDNLATELEFSIYNRMLVTLGIDTNNTTPSKVGP